MAVASEQEMKAKAQEARAKVIEAEAEVPKAMADAFRSGNLGIMKYKQLPIGETKGTWKNNRPAEAARFCLLFSIKCSEWNKIFDLPGGKKLEDNNFPRVRDTDSETPTYKMIGKLCEIFPELAKAYK